MTEPGIVLTSTVAPQEVRLRLPTLAFLWDTHPELRPVLLAAAEGGKITRREFAEALQASLGGEITYHRGHDPEELL
jgi:hypothetical protein